MQVRFAVAFAVLALASATVVQRAESADPLQAQYRGCKTAGWCALRIESLVPLAASLDRVYPQGIARTPDNAARFVAIPDRLNALLASMVHQHKRILLRDFRQIEDAVYSAIVTVNGAVLINPLTPDTNCKVLELPCGSPSRMRASVMKPAAVPLRHPGAHAHS